MGKRDLKIYEFSLFSERSDIDHAVFTRDGGHSEPPYESLNIGMHTGDSLSAVAANRKQIIFKMGMRPMIFLKQVHGDHIKVLKKDDTDFANKFQPGQDIYTADGIVTDMVGVMLVIQVADCQSVMLYDPAKRVVANVHSGWRGSIANIVGGCVDVMILEFGCSPSDILAGISPSLGPCCAQFIHFKEEIPEGFWQYKAKGDDPLFDFWRITGDQLAQKGIPKENIETMQICSKCNSQIFFSYRKSRQTGRFACVIGMA